MSQSQLLSLERLQLVRMEKTHRDNIHRHYVKLCDELEVDDVLVHLEENKIFTPEMVEEITAKATKKAKSRELLCILTRRGCRAFEYFRLALINTNQRHLAKLLTDDSNGGNRTPVDVEMGPGHLVIDEAVNVQIGPNNVLAVNEPDICW